MSRGRFQALPLLVLLFCFSIGKSGAEERKNFSIPDELTAELKVKATYNNRFVFFRFEWPAQVGSIYHDYIHHAGGKWERTKGSEPGVHPQKLYEDRVSFLLDDGSVRYFDTAGGYVTVHEEMRFLSNQAAPEAVKAHPYLGDKKGHSDVRKYTPETRTSGDWRNMVGESELENLKSNGVFLDLWMWRSHRSNPVGYADDMWVLEYRNGDQGKSSYADNWDGEKKQPKFMYDPDKVGFKSLNWEDVINHRLGQDDIYYLSEKMAKPFDPALGWKEGDTIPRRLLRIPEGSRGDIKGKGVWRDGRWQVDLVRLLDTGHPDDKALRPKRRYTVAFAIHKNYTGSRWHHVSLPMTLGMGVEGEIEARPFNGEDPPWEEIPWTHVTLFYPGQVTWEWLLGSAHAGSAELAAGQSCASCHTPELLGRYSVEHELRDEIRNGWYWTLASGFILVAGLSLAGVIISRKGS